MRHPTLVFKILFLIGALLCVESGFSPLYACYGSLLFATILNTFLAIRPNPHLLPNPTPLFIFPLLFCIMHFVLEAERPKGEIPDELFIGGEEPIYDRSILAGVTVTEMISPGLYLANARFQMIQKKPPKRRKRSPGRFLRERSGGGEPDGNSRRRRYRAKEVSARQSIGDHGIGSTRRKKGFSKKRAYGKHVKSGEEWVTERGLDLSAPLLIRTSNENLHEGCILSIRFYGRGNLRRFEDSNYGRYLAGRGALAIANVSERYHVNEIDCSRIEPRGKFRRAVKDALARTGFREGAMDATLGIVLGKAGYLDRSLKRGARELGILHLFAASGLHLGIFYVCLYFPLRLILGRMHPVALITPLPLSFLYLYLLGFPVSLVRSFLFISLYALKSIIHRGVPVSHHLLNTALFMIVIMPNEFASLSALLSFGAVAGIMYFYAHIRRLVGVKMKIVSLLCDNAAMSLSASILTTPVLIWVFHAYSFGSPLVNTFLVPYTSLLLPLLYCGILLDILLSIPLLSELLLVPARFGMELFVSAVQNLESAGLYVVYDHPFALPMFLSLAIFAILIRVRILSGKKGDGKALNELRLHGIGLFALLMLSGPAGYALEHLFRLIGASI
jgi:ComEC/Rec2-related protein